MKDYQADFLELCLENDVLLFGEFTLKSGRVSPYFFNAGKFDNGRLLEQLAVGYARLIAENLGSRVMLYGPAYKGIPLVAATAVNLSARHGLEIDYAYNRKEIKDHGEGGVTVGADIRGEVVIIDDVITAGNSVYESARIIGQSGARVRAVVIALDRQEVAQGKRLSAVQEVEDRLGTRVYSLIQLETLIEYLEATDRFRSHAPRVAAYREEYGLKT